ncbi:competence-specific global transcription modulator [Streptococcus pneumoniae]|nr:competence-specific global transcription modulator [Streptococcus pneumoniae]
MIKELYEEVQGTVYKCRNEYYLIYGNYRIGTKKACSAYMN